MNRPAGAPCARSGRPRVVRHPSSRSYRPPQWSPSSQPGPSFRWYRPRRWSPPRRWCPRRRRVLPPHWSPRRRWFRRCRLRRSCPPFRLRRWFHGPGRAGGPVVPAAPAGPRGTLAAGPRAGAGAAAGTARPTADLRRTGRQQDGRQIDRGQRLAGCRHAEGVSAARLNSPWAPYNESVRDGQPRRTWAGGGCFPLERGRYLACAGPSWRPAHDPLGRADRERGRLDAGAAQPGRQPGKPRMVLRRRRVGRSRDPGAPADGRAPACASPT